MPIGRLQRDWGVKAASTLMFCAANPLATTAYLPGLTELLDPSPELSMKELRFRKTFWIHRVRNQASYFELQEWTGISTMLLKISSFHLCKWLLCCNFFAWCCCCSVQEDLIFYEKNTVLPVGKEREKMSEANPVDFHTIRTTKQSSSEPASGGWWPTSLVDLQQKNPTEYPQTLSPSGNRAWNVWTT